MKILFLIFCVRSMWKNVILYFPVTSKDVSFICILYDYIVVVLDV